MGYIWIINLPIFYVPGKEFTYKDLSETMKIIKTSGYNFSTNEEIVPNKKKATPNSKANANNKKVRYFFKLIKIFGFMPSLCQVHLTFIKVSPSKFSVTLHDFQKNWSNLDKNGNNLLQLFKKELFKANLSVF